METERPIYHEQYTSDQFLQELERVWEGPLYYGFHPGFENVSLDIQSNGIKAIMTAHKYAERVSPASGVQILSFNICKDFRTIVLREMPSPAKAAHPVNMVSDVFARAMLTERLENFFRHTIPTYLEEQGNIIQDQLPYPLEYSGVLFDEPDWQEKSFSTLVALARQRVYDYATRFDFNAIELQRFITDYQASLDTLAYSLTLTHQQRGRIHPMITVESAQAWLRYIIEREENESEDKD